MVVHVHFDGRADLLLQLARYVDEKNDIRGTLAPVEAAQNGTELLARLAGFLADYNPCIHAVVRMSDTLRHGDPDIEQAWRDRLLAWRAGSRQVGARLHVWKELAPEWTVETARDWITAMSSVRLWEELVMDLAWSKRKFVKHMTTNLQHALLRDPPVR